MDHTTGRRLLVDSVEFWKDAQSCKSCHDVKFLHIILQFNTVCHSLLKCFQCEKGCSSSRKNSWNFFIASTSLPRFRSSKKSEFTRKQAVWQSEPVVCGIRLLRQIHCFIFNRQLYSFCHLYPSSVSRPLGARDQSTNRDAKDCRCNVLKGSRNKKRLYRGSSYYWLGNELGIGTKEWVASTQLRQAWPCFTLKTF